ncbi:uncharacterized protein LOC106420397 [Brassica napus]|uniref:uncharacterized protein LOC106420397 n=1 Tax=Brassica napus TaxID=3708 RepID=UPI002078BCAD|nr:uncharacterized protein LOC106420397 [Brassica napus]
MELDPYTPPSLNIIHCVTAKLNEQNFLFWKRQFQSFLSGQRLFGFVTGTIPQPVSTILAPSIQGTSTPVPNPDHELWWQTDQVIQSWLLGSVTDQLQSVVVHCTTSHEIWTTLDNHFNRPSNSRLFELQRKLQTVTKATKTMDVYLQEIKTISDQLTSIGSPMTEVMKIFTALRGLGKDFEPIKTAIEGTIDSQPSTTFDSTCLDLLPLMTDLRVMILAKKLLLTWLSHQFAQVKGASITLHEEEEAEVDLELVVEDTTQQKVAALCSSSPPLRQIRALSVRSVENQDIKHSDATFATTTTTSLKNLLKPLLLCALLTFLMRQVLTGMLTLQLLLTSPTLCTTCNMLSLITVQIQLWLEMGHIFL